MPKGSKGNDLPKKTTKRLLAEITEKCNGGRYATREATGNTNHTKN
jgi:hypothetical protein